MPPGDEVQGRVRGREPTSVEDAYEPTASNEDVAWDEVAVRHDVEAGARQPTQVRPQPARTFDVQQATALLEAELHPVVVVREVAAPPRAGERSSARVGGPQAGDERRRGPRRRAQIRKRPRRLPLGQAA